MNKRLGILITVILAFLAMPFLSSAEEQPEERARKHKSYTLVDVGTLGGRNSTVGVGHVLINPRGAVIGNADTSILDPTCSCPSHHAFKWQKGVLTDLHPLPGSLNSTAYSINSEGTVAGWTENGLVDPDTPVPVFVAATWKNGQITDLGTLGGSFSLAIAINDPGQAAGAAENTTRDPDGFGTALIFGAFIPTNQFHAALWRHGTIQDLGTLGDGPGSVADFVNERGQVAGASFTDSTPTVFGFPTVHPFLWEHGHMVDLGSLGGVYAIATGLNDRGQVAGFSTLAGELTSHAFLWAQREMQDLGTLGGIQSAANALNEKGEIAGESTTDQAVHAFIWKRGVMTDLGGAPGYGDCSNTSSINAKSDVVGWAWPCAGIDAPDHAVLWEKGRPGVDLNTLVPSSADLELIEADFINDRGEIAGLARLSNGDEHVFVLIPKEGDDDDDMESATVAASSKLAPPTRSTAIVARATLTPEMKDALRTQFANRHRRFGLGLPKQVR